MITFRLLDHTASNENIVQINPNHIVSIQCEIEYEHIDALGDYGRIAYTSSYRDWETDRKSTRLNSSHRSLSRMPSSA